MQLFASKCVIEFAFGKGRSSRGQGSHAILVHYRVTGRDDFLAIARKAADFLDRTFRDSTPELASNSACPSHYMAIVELAECPPREFALRRFR